MSDKIVDVTDMNFEEEVVKSDKPVLVDFWAPWCAPCKMLEPIFEKLAEEYDGQVKFVKINTDENPATAIRFNIQGIPTTILFKDGDEFQRLVGVNPENNYKMILDAALGKGWAEQQGEVKKVKDNVFEVKGVGAFNKMIKDEKVTMVDFWAPWCGPCRMISPVMEQLADEYKDKVQLVKVNVDEPENQMLAMQYGVHSIPQISFFKSWVMVDQFVGAYPYEQVKHILQHVLWEAHDHHDHDHHH